MGDLKIKLPGLLIILTFIAACDITSDLEPAKNNTNEFATPTSKLKSAATSSSYELKVPDIGSPFGAFGYDVNDQGVVAGWIWETVSFRSAFIYDSSNGLTILPRFNNASNYSASNINNNGDVLGAANIGEPRISFIWNPTDGYTFINSASVDAQARVMNELGEVAGWIRSGPVGQAVFSPFRWDESTGITDISGQTGITSNMRALNNNGLIAGRTASTSKAVIVHPIHGEQEIPLPSNSTSSIASGLNQNNEVVGSYTINNQQYSYAYKWSASGGFTALQNDGDFGSRPNDINDSGVVVGTDSDIRSGSTVAVPVVWSPDGTKTHLPLGNFLAGVATSINENGVIAGYVHNGNLVQSTLAIWYPAEPEDTEPPVISLNQEQESLWPPNHKMELVLSGISADDNIDEDPEIIIEVTSNEASNGKGDGNTNQDWEVVDNGDGTFDVYLRSERSGKGNGRTYTVTITATDDAGNAASESLSIEVRKNQSTSRWIR